MADTPFQDWETTPKRPPRDRTFDPLSSYASEHWCAARLGRSHRWFKDNLHRLHKTGFPAPDRLVGFWIKADVDAWIEARRVLKDDQPQLGGTVNYDAL